MITFRIVFVLRKFFVTWQYCPTFICLKGKQFFSPFNIQFSSSLVEFTWKRVAARGAVLLAILITAEIFPRFGPIVDLVGGSINVGICFIFPIWFYLKLFPERKMSEKILLGAIVTIGVLGGICSTVSNVNNVINTFQALYAKNVHNATHHAW